MSKPFLYFKKTIHDTYHTVYSILLPLSIPDAGYFMGIVLNQLIKK